MKSHLLLLASLLAIPSVHAAIRYVDVNSANPSPPYTSWATASATIQAAVDVADVGDEIVVTNGTYSSGVTVTTDGTNRVAITKPLTIRSINGPQFTIIEGSYARTNFGSSWEFSGGVRCAYLTNGAVLSGFTLRKGAHFFRGGGVFGDGEAVITNCVLIENQARYGAGAVGVILHDCVLTRNWASTQGGGAFSSTLYDCSVISNTADSLPAQFFSDGLGGGVDSCTLSNCSLIGNIARDEGGGAFDSHLNDCIVIGNSGLGGYGYPGVGGLAFGSANNCLIVSNFSALVAGGARGCALTNCTVVGNSAASGAGGVSDSTLYNCIVYFNTATNGPNYLIGTMTPGTFNYCCTTPEPTNGIGNIVTDPLFADIASGNFHLSPDSPCINAGNNAYAPSGPDFDGNPRIVGSTIDIGAYEFQSPTSKIAYGWLQHYGLPTDGTADFLDSDGDGMNNWQEWMAGTCPTNALSALRIRAASTNPSGIAVEWESANGKTYYLQRGTNLSVEPVFSSVQSNIIGQAGTTTYTDTNAFGAGPFFYRVGVQ